jgi:hypothetical protein
MAANSKHSLNVKTLPILTHLLRGADLRLLSVARALRCRGVFTCQHLACIAIQGQG